jgi:hypothetical protein
MFRVLAIQDEVMWISRLAATTPDSRGALPLFHHLEQDLVITSVIGKPLLPER